MSTPHGEFIAGCRLADFEIVREIAAGQNGQVFEVRCTKGGNPAPGRGYALKALFNFGVETKALSNAFEREFVILEHVPKHPHLLKLLAQWREPIPDSIFERLPPFARDHAVHAGGRRRTAQFVLFSLHSQSLQQYLDARRGLHLPWDTLLPMSLQLVSAVAHLHSQNVAHLDIKPDNILLDIRGGGKPHIVLCDLGCARRFGDGKWMATGRDMAEGNTAHRAPEALALHREFLLDASSTRTAYIGTQPSFAAGVVLYEMATLGQHPIPGYPRESYAVEEVLEAPDAYPAVLTHVIKALLNPDPAYRLDLHGALTMLARSGATSSTPADSAAELAKMAVAADTRNDYAAAVDLYTRAGMALLEMSAEGDAAARKVARERALTYTERAEQLHEALSGTAASGAPSSFSDAMDVLQAAVAADTRKAYAEALSNYTRGLELLLAALPSLTPDAQAVARTKASEYMSRAEQLKPFVEAPPSPATPAPFGSPELFALLEAATKADRAKNKRVAYDKYVQAAGVMLRLMSTADPAQKLDLQQRSETVMNRAEHLKRLMSATAAWDAPPPPMPKDEEW